MTFCNYNSLLSDATDVLLTFLWFELSLTLLLPLPFQNSLNTYSFYFLNVKFENWTVNERFKAFVTEHSLDYSPTLLSAFSQFAFLSNKIANLTVILFPNLLRTNPKRSGNKINLTDQQTVRRSSKQLCTYQCLAPMGGVRAHMGYWQENIARVMGNLFFWPGHLRGSGLFTFLIEVDWACY